MQLEHTDIQSDNYILHAGSIEIYSTIKLVETLTMLAEQHNALGYYIRDVIMPTLVNSGLHEVVASQEVLVCNPEYIQTYPAMMMYDTLDYVLNMYNNQRGLVIEPYMLRKMWDLAPSWASWIAIDKDGSVFAYVDRPMLADNNSAWVLYTTKNDPIMTKLFNIYGEPEVIGMPPGYFSMDMIGNNIAKFIFSR